MRGCGGEGGREGKPSPGHDRYAAFFRPTLAFCFVDSGSGIGMKPGSLAILFSSDPVDTQPPSKTEGEHPPQRKHKGGRAEARPPPRQWSPYATSYVALPPSVDTRTMPFAHAGAGMSNTAVSAPSK